MRSRKKCQEGVHARRGRFPPKGSLPLLTVRSETPREHVAVFIGAIKPFYELFLGKPQPRIEVNKRLVYRIDRREAVDLHLVDLIEQHLA